LTPAGAIVGLAALVPLVLLALAGRRTERARVAIGLERLGVRELVAPAAAVAAIGALVALAAAQPVWRSRDEALVRTDAAAYVVLDTSRSMLAAGGPSSENRLERARRLALRVRAALGNVPVGLASLSDRTLPHLFPSPDREAFASTLARALDGGRPTPVGFGESGTDLTALASLPTSNYFQPSVTRRLAVVLTDAESRPVDVQRLDSAFRSVPRTTLVLVRIGRSGERVVDARGREEEGYLPVAGAAEIAASVAAVTSGSAHSEAEVEAAVDAAVDAVGDAGPTTATGRGAHRRPLAAWMLAAAVLPLGYLIRRRNLDPHG
jgi:hypothetical protein